MTETLRLIAFILLAAGILLIAFSVYMYVKKDIRKIQQDLKSTKQVSAEKETDNTLTNNIYYRSEAETVKSKELKVRPKGFRRQQERLAKNDTGLLRTALPDNSSRKEDEKKEYEIIKKPAEKYAERPATSPVRKPSVKEVPEDNNNINGNAANNKTFTAPLQQTPAQSSTDQVLRKIEDVEKTGEMKVVNFNNPIEKVIEKPAEDRAVKSEKRGQTAPLIPAIEKTATEKNTAPLKMESVATDINVQEIFEFKGKEDVVVNKELVKSDNKKQTAPLDLETVKPDKKNTAPLIPTANGTSATGQVRFEKNAERPAANRAVRVEKKGHTAPLKSAPKNTAPLKMERHGTSVLEVEPDDSEPVVQNRGKDTLPLK